MEFNKIIGELTNLEIKKNKLGEELTEFKEKNPNHIIYAAQYVIQSDRGRRYHYALFSTKDNARKFISDFIENNNCHEDFVYNFIYSIALKNITVGLTDIDSFDGIWSMLPNCETEEVYDGEKSDTISY